MALAKLAALVMKCQLRMVAKEKIACAVQKLVHAQLPQTVQAYVQTAGIVLLPLLVLLVLEQDVPAALVGVLCCTIFFLVMVSSVGHVFVFFIY